jgi:hypothetical protein
MSNYEINIHIKKLVSVCMRENYYQILANIFDGMLLYIVIII